MLYIRRLVWDNGNQEHISRHQVMPHEVEEVCHGQPIVQQGHGGRSLVIGPARNGRMLTVVLDPELDEGVYYVVTARPTSRRERAIYRQEREVSER